LSQSEAISEAGWFETITMGEGVTLIHEPWIKPFFRCNMWHVRGRDRDLLFDTGLGVFPLRRHIAALTERTPLCVASHTHFDHIGGHHEFPQRCVHAAEAAILADPRPRAGARQPTRSRRRRRRTCCRTAPSSISVTVSSR
jgi:glyoxylase-like metal-dependent hydrolase (beta-lactamase superfamily II)